MRGKIVYGISFLAMFCVKSNSLTAQRINDFVSPSINQLALERKDSILSICFQVNTDSLYLASNRAVKLQPVLVNGDSSLVLKPIVIAGRRQAIMHRRENRNGVLLKLNNSKQQEKVYEDLVVFQEWMNGSELKIMQDLCGCGGNPLTHQQTNCFPVWVDVPVYEVKPSLAFVKPKAEGVKLRTEKGQAFLDFPVNETVIYPHYRQNPVELQKIRHTVDLIKNDSNTQITQICIHGFASPEGSWTNNRRLAHERADALKQYVCDLYRFDEAIFKVSSTPEDWNGLRKWVDYSDLKQKKEVLNILASVVDEDERNAALQKLDNGKVYAKLLKEVYPALRHSDYAVHFTVRAFNLEEAKRLIKTRPQMLSLQEMYQVASCYPTGSDAFQEVFDIAVRLFPEDEIANLNMALSLLQRKDFSRAERYLQKAGNSPEAKHAQGVLLLMIGQYDLAEKLLQEAADKGIKEATDNLEQLRMKKENIKKRNYAK